MVTDTVILQLMNAQRHVSSIVVTVRSHVAMVSVLQQLHQAQRPAHPVHRTVGPVQHVVIVCVMVLKISGPVHRIVVPLITVGTVTVHRLLGKTITTARRIVIHPFVVMVYVMDMKRVISVLLIVELVLLL